MTQSDAVINTLENLGGIATLGQLNHEVFNIKNCKWGTKTPFASIRRIVQTNDKIYKIKPGLYGLLKFKKLIEERGIFADGSANQESKQNSDFDHSYYQGLLLTIGKLKGLNTFAPAQDKNKRFIDQKIGNLSTFKEIPPYSYPIFTKRSSTIDVIWFNERKMPDTFFEVEHSTDIQNSLMKFNDLLDFNSKMVIVANKRRESEFITKISNKVFTDLQKPKRVTFLCYNELEIQYEMMLKKSSFNHPLF